MIAIVLTLLASALVSGDSLNVISRIVGGQIAPTGAYPFMVSLRAYDSENSDYHYCGGSIISTKTILTAGHCVDWLPAKSIDVVFGSNQLGCKGIRYRAARTLLHPSYSSTNYTNNIGLVFFANHIEYGPTVQAIVPDWNVIGSAKDVMAMGWGRVVANETAPSNDLIHYKTSTISNYDCRARFAGNAPRPIQDYELCTTLASGVGSCSDDGGGPIVFEGKLVGIISLRLRCANAFPDIAIRVSSFRTWIEENTI